MINIDFRTLFFTLSVTYIICTLMIIIVWMLFRNNYAGTDRLLIGYILQTFGLSLLLDRQTIPDWASVIAANALLIAGITLVYEGMHEYLGFRNKSTVNYIILSLFIIIHIWFTYADPDLNARSINISAASFLIFFQSAWLMFKGIKKTDKEFLVPAGIIFLTFSIISLCRLVYNIVYKTDSNDYFESGQIESFITILYFVLVISITFSISLIYSWNMIVDLKRGVRKNI
jgi:hypothetical protein